MINIHFIQVKDVMKSEMKNETRSPDEALTQVINFIKELHEIVN